MTRRTIAIFACMILCGISVPSHAAEISCAPVHTISVDEANSGDYVLELQDNNAPVRTTCVSGLLNGQISKGDYEKVATFFKAYHPDHFELNSPGGDVDEALKIGRLFRKYLISTSDGYAGTCASACAFIWFGGVFRGGTVGLHRPRSIDPMFRGLSPPDASIAYRRVLERIAAYLDEMEVPKSIIELMVATGSADINWVDASTYGLSRPPSIAEWEDASCGFPSSLAEVCAGHACGGLSGPSGPEKKLQCLRLLLSSHRDRLAPP
jgi:hypothetical protein